MKLFNKCEYCFILGLIDLGEGRIDSAKRNLAEMKSAFSELDQYQKECVTFFYNQLQAEVSFLEGSPDKAITVFKKATSPRSPALQYTEWMMVYNIPFLKDVKARAYQQKGETDKAIAEYERLITFDPKLKGRHLIHPRYYYKLAKLYEQKGWKGKAIEFCEKFLDLWKDADPGIPEVEDVKKRLAALKN